MSDPSNSPQDDPQRSPRQPQHQPQGKPSKYDATSDPKLWLSFPHWLRTEGTDRIRKAWPWMLGCVAVGVTLAWFVPTPLPTIATSVLAPFGSLLIGMAFAWSVTFTSLIQSTYGQKFGEWNRGLHYRTLVMKYHFSLFTIFSLAVLWTVIGTDVFHHLAAMVPFLVRRIARIVVYTLTAFVMMEMWDAIADVQRMLLSVEWMRRLDEPGLQGEGVRGEGPSNVLHRARGSF